MTRMKSPVGQKVGVTQSGSLVDTWVCMCVGHVQSGLFCEVIVLSSVRPLIGQHWRVPAVCWRAHNVTRNSSCPTAMQHGVLQKPPALHCVQNCPVLSCPVHTDPVVSLLPPKYTLQSNCKSVTDECEGAFALYTLKPYKIFVGVL